ncbi:MAG: hypothetical protein RML36_05990, partial [Anaerolineae bacterium]|nr:hypothetical protein [Anaerolineae bacterium]
QELATVAEQLQALVAQFRLSTERATITTITMEERPGKPSGRSDGRPTAWERAEAIPAASRPAAPTLVGNGRR